MPPNKTKGETVKEIVELPKKLDEDFRKTVAEVKGLHKGVLKESFEEALVSWIKEQKKRKQPSK